MDTPTAGGTQEVNYIPEGDLYRLIIRSKLPAAERFEQWVFDEVLPTIRKQSAYFVLESPASKQFLSDIIVETIKQIIPLISHNVQTSLDITATEQMPRKRRRHKVVDGIIERIDPSLRRRVDEMLGESGCYTYCDIAEFLQDHGISISGTSVQRYYFRMLARAQPELMSCNQESSNTSVVPIFIQMPTASGKS